MYDYINIDIYIYMVLCTSNIYMIFPPTKNLVTYFTTFYNINDQKKTNWNTITFLPPPGPENRGPKIPSRLPMFQTKLWFIPTISLGSIVVVAIDRLINKQT